MSFYCYLDTYRKRENSTTRPDAENMERYDCVILRGSGVMNPKIEFDFGPDGDPTVYNYALITSFEHRYYWIREWYYDNGLWTAYMEVDVLATYRAEIGNSNLYLLRAANAYNGDIIDNLYPTKTGCSFSHVTKDNPWVGTASGTYIIGVVSRHGQYGSITYYALSPANMSIFVTGLIQNTIVNSNGFSWDDASQALQKAIIDPIQYIRSCIFIPRPPSQIDGVEVHSIPVFDWSVDATAKIPSQPYEYISYSYSIPQHPDTNSRGNYVNSSPYTVLTLAAQPFGVIEIDTTVTANSANIQVDVHLDIFTGLAVLEVICNGEIINSIESQVGVPIQISQVTRDFLGGAMSALGAIGSGIGRDFMGALAGIGSAFQSMVPRSNTIGSQGSFTALRSTLPFRLTAQFFRPVADDLTHNGRPLCARRTIKDVGGYMLVQDGDVIMDGTLEEARRVKEYLETGFYYE